MTDRPIIFSAPMVRALLAGSKTQTRRVLKPQPKIEYLASERLEDHELRGWECVAQADGRHAIVKQMSYAPGDRLYVRETFAMGFDYDEDDKPIGDEPKPFYAATHGIGRWYDPDKDEWRDEPRWTPSIHMPRWASRLTLIVKAVKIERLTDISESDAEAEGPQIGGDNTEYGDERNYYEGFRDLWESINGAGSWDANPWIVAVTFRVVRGNIDAVPA
jgi:hypothetical protein